MKRRNFIKTTAYPSLVAGLVSTRGYAAASTHTDCDCSFLVSVGGTYQPNAATIADAISEMGNGNSIVTAIADKLKALVSSVVAPVTDAVYKASPELLQDFWDYVGDGWRQIAGDTAPVREAIADYTADKWDELTENLANALEINPITKNTTARVRCIEGEFNDEPADVDVTKPGSILDSELTVGPITATYKISIETEVSVSASCGDNDSCTATVTVKQKMTIEVSAEVDTPAGKVKVTGDSEQLLDDLTNSESC
jgi:hypothetical protein